MQSPSVWEMLLVGIMVLGILFWLRPGIRAALERSRTAEKHWASALIPIVLVVLFVIFLIMVT